MSQNSQKTKHGVKRGYGEQKSPHPKRRKLDKTSPSIQASQETQHTKHKKQSVSGKRSKKSRRRQRKKNIPNQDKK